MRPRNKSRGNGGFRLMKRRIPRGQYVVSQVRGHEPLQRLMFAPVSLRLPVKFADDGPRQIQIASPETRWHAWHRTPPRFSSVMLGRAECASAARDGARIAHQNRRSTAIISAVSGAQRANRFPDEWIYGRASALRRRAGRNRAIVRGSPLQSWWSRVPCSVAGRRTRALYFESAAYATPRWQQMTTAARLPGAATRAAGHVKPLDAGRHVAIMIQRRWPRNSGPLRGPRRDLTRGWRGRGCWTASFHHQVPKGLLNGRTARYSC